MSAYRFLARGVLATVFGLSVLAAGCDDDPVGDGAGDTLTSRTVRVQGAEFTAQVQVMESFPVQLAGTLKIENSGSERVVLIFPDGCIALLRAFAGDPTQAEPIWDQRDEVACTLAIETVELDPGEERTFNTPINSARDILGEEHPDGDYRIAVYARPVGNEVVLEAGTVRLVSPR